MAAKGKWPGRRERCCKNSPLRHQDAKPHQSAMGFPLLCALVAPARFVVSDLDLVFTVCLNHLNKLIEQIGRIVGARSCLGVILD